LNYRLSGEEVTGYHVVNIALHLGNALLVAWFARLLTTLRNRHQGDGGVVSLTDGRANPDLAATIAGILFCVHPIATQTVCYLTQRSTSIASFFFLLSLATYIHLRVANRSRGMVILLSLFGLATYQVCLHSKHVALMLPFVVVAFEWLFRAPAGRLPRSSAVLLAGFFVLVVLRARDFVGRFAPVVLHGVRSLSSGGSGDPGSQFAAGLPGTTVDSASYFLTQFPVVVTYLRLLIVPHGQNLDHHVVPATALREPHVFLSAALLAGLLVVSILVRKRDPIGSFGVLLFFLALVPTSTLMPSNDFFTANKFGGLPNLFLPEWLDQPNTSELNANRAFGPVVGYEHRVRSFFGIEAIVGRSSHQVDLGSTEFAEFTMTPLMVGANFHYVQPDLDFYFGPRIAYVLYGDLEAVDGRRTDSPNRTAFGGVLGFDLPLGKSDWLVAGSLQFAYTDSGPGLAINPVALTVGAGFRL
jgi:hypothetical protein